MRQCVLDPEAKRCKENVPSFKIHCAFCLQTRGHRVCPPSATTLGAGSAFKVCRIPSIKDLVIKAGLQKAVGKWPIIADPAYCCNFDGGPFKSKCYWREARAMPDEYVAITTRHETMLQHCYEEAVRDECRGELPGEFGTLEHINGFIPRSEMEPLGLARRGAEDDSENVGQTAHRRLRACGEHEGMPL